tara:strand:- start:2282 stop:2521 length:240 start_codon:yes stop_codon:yes gene_type:complete
MERIPAGMRIVAPGMVEEEEKGRVIPEEEEIPEKGQGAREAGVQGTMVAVLEKILEGVEEGEESRSPAWCFRYDPRKYY